MQLEEKLQNYFGYTTFRPGQREVIEQLLMGKDVIALLPTGMGKSLCYQLPGYIFNNPVLIISPLLSLMQDQVSQLKQNGEKSVVALNSFLTFEQKNRALNHLQQYRFIFISPEMLLQNFVRQQLATINLSLIVVDEAHCISQWGFDFRPDYLRIGDVFNYENRPPILALSATATKKVAADIEHYLKLKNPFQYIHSVDRPNIHLGRISFNNQEEKIEWIINHVQQYEGPGIIYTQSRAKTDAIAERLLNVGIKAASYHGGKDSLDRQFIQQQFIEGSLDWIVATNAFGMGVNKHNVRQILHLSLPSSMENYMQEIGRAGRDGKDALAIILYSPGDEDIARNLATDDLPTIEHINLYLDYFNQLDTLVQQGYMSETVFRVLNYWMEHFPKEQVEKILNEMRYEKIRAIDTMMKLITSNCCMREMIVNYFEQKILTKPENCCEYCGIHYDDLISPRKKEDKSHNQLTWKDRIKTILLGIEE